MATPPLTTLPLMLSVWPLLCNVVILCTLHVLLFLLVIAVSLHSLHLLGSFLLHFLSLFTTMFCDYFKVKKKLALRLEWQFLFRLP